MLQCQNKKLCKYLSSQTHRVLLYQITISDFNLFKMMRYTFIFIIHEIKVAVFLDMCDPSLNKQ